MQTTIEKMWEDRKQKMWQKVYDKGFVDALDKGANLEEACEAGDKRVLDTFDALINFVPED